MALRRMQVTDVRCLHQGDIEFDSQFTLISGPNASGKTSLLEAIYVLGRGRSFRTRRLEHLIRTGADRLIVFGETDDAVRRVTLGVEASAKGVQARLGGQRVESLADLAAALPVQIIDPEVHRLIEEGPSRRRRFLDWGVFHVEPSFVGHWQKYHQVLRQRNAALRSGQPVALVSAWDAELSRYAGLLTDARSRYVELLAPIAKQVAESLLGMELSLGYRPGWLRELEFPQALERSWRHDQELGSTQVGPQRAELTIKLDGVPARDRISRGQQKLLAAVLLISQIKLLKEDAAARPVLLLDDPAAELDMDRLTAFIAEVRAQPLQLVVTTLNKDVTEFGAFGRPGRRYRLEQGAIFGE
ncbi:MAG: DNA replication/repair protein RecF [Steroidobacteraceae bacterium]|jgi:DNA replication and repair protein RecF